MGVIERIFRREGRKTNDPSDSGGRTDWGISERSHPDVWADGRVTEAEARGVYQADYVSPFESVSEPYLKEQLIDFAVTSGAVTSTMLLQKVLGVSVDGILGPETLKAIEHFPSAIIFGFPVPSSVALNFAFERARGAFYVRVAQRRPKDLRYLFGWLKRVVGIEGEEL